MPFRPLSLLLFLIVAHLTPAALADRSSFYVASERAKSLIVEACTYERPLIGRSEPLVAIHPLPPANKLKWCLTLHTNKGTSQLEQELKRTTQLVPLVDLSWRRLSAAEDAPVECRVKFKGYQREYRLAPSLGHYQACQQDISRYTNLLSKTRNQSLKGPYINISNECPLQELPASFEAYRACDLLPEQWYELKFRSSIRAEINENKQYRQYWFNHTQTFVFKPHATTQTEGSNRDWLSKVLTIKLSVNKCDADFLIEKDNDWPHDVTLLGYYQYRTHTHLPAIYRLGNMTVANTTLSVRHPWLSGTFPLQKDNETERNQLHVPVVECCASHTVAMIVMICLTALATSM
uniref:Uncharacterized protein n=1 Tax=Plectus sambesii TaxID=2011161 RepID=A0A914VNY6_9BILA